MKLNAILYIPNKDGRFKVKCKIDYLYPNSSTDYKYTDILMSEMEMEALVFLTNMGKNEINYFDVSIGNETWVLAGSNIHSIRENRLIIRSKRIILSEG